MLKQDRLSWIDILKGIGIILVVIGHIYANDTTFNWIYSFHMPLFFFAAGWLYKKRDIWKYIKSKIITVVIPYFAFSYSVLIYWLFIERRFREASGGYN